jgi:D-alanyl-D-alanine carboxypeptidase (penicillin-binding protein 5/6)
VLASHVLQDPLLSKIVATRQRGCRVSGPGGYTRNVLWKNTNRLLAIEGYGGVKTGTTDAAGACLAAYGVRGEQALIVVVLGSTSSDARYVDARNLFRWAWSQGK